MTTKHGLGRGLKALIKDTADSGGPKEPEAGIRTVLADKIIANSFQPRHTFPEEGMEDLVRSVKDCGVVQPLLVRRKGDSFELIAGERRLRAAKAAGRTEVPVIILEADDRQSLELALIENLQRENLNVVEEAEGYKTLADKFNLTQEQIADRVGKARASVANTMRLVELPQEIKEYIVTGKLQAGHAKVLLGLDMPEERLLLAGQAIREGMSVRELEKLVEKTRQAPRKPRVSRSDIPPVHVSHIADQLRRKFGTAVRLVSCRTLANGKKARGLIEIDFYSPEDLDRILHILDVTEQGQ